jgi:hypothetical protein
MASHAMSMSACVFQSVNTDHCCSVFRFTISPDTIRLTHYPPNAKHVGECSRNSLVIFPIRKVARSAEDRKKATGVAVDGTWKRATGIRISICRISLTPLIGQV